MIDHAERQRSIIASENLVFIDENVSQEAFVMGSRRGEYPVGARWFWALQQVWAPRKSIIEREAAE
jgi:hypothetical protein